MLAERLAQSSCRDVSRETSEAVAEFADQLAEANKSQNLISKNSEADLIERHIVDGVQLLRHDTRRDAHWIDIGTGPGLPGLVIALVHEGPVTLIEPRALRVTFLNQMIAHFGLQQRVAVIAGKASAASVSGDVITGRAVASLSKFIDLSHHLSTEKTRWILPKGKKAMEELEEAKRFWQLDVRVEDSLTDPYAKIVVIDRAKRRGRP